MDFNQPLDENTNKYNIQDLARDCDLGSSMEMKHQQDIKNSTRKGSKAIDHILIANGTALLVTKSRQLPFDFGFDTDHHGFFADVSAADLLHPLKWRGNV